ncbi:hypothetical protein ACZ87_00604, partial [Candidatus Erwinia dacicola]
MTHLIEVRSLGIKAAYQPVRVLIHPQFPRVIRPCKEDFCFGNLRDLLMLRELRAII